MFLWGHVEEKIYISTYRRRMNTKLGKKLTRYVRRFQTERRMNFWLRDQREVTRQFKKSESPLSQGL